jgi:hypothetical protein
MRNKIVSLAACTLLCGAVYANDDDPPAPVAADAKPDGTVNLKGGSVAAGIGYTWGSGELNYNQGSHEFAIHGVSVVDVGVTNFTATGEVYNLKKLSDFAGNYSAVGAGLTIAGGATAVFLKNKNGVIIKLRATDVGLKFTLAGEGVRVSLKN